MSAPFRERNPVVIGAVSLAVIVAFILAAFKAEDLPLIGGGDTYYAAFSEAGGLKANDEVRVAGVRVGKVQTRRPRRRPRPGRPSRSRRASTSARTPAPRSRSRRCSARCTSASSRRGAASSPEGTEIPRQPHHLAVRRRGGVLRAGRPLRADRHRPAGQVPEHPRRPDQEHPRGVPVRARRPVRPVARTSRPATSSSTRCCATPRRSPPSSVTAAATSITLMRDGDKLFRALAARRRVGAQPARRDQPAVDPADRPGARHPRRTSSRPSTTSATSWTCSTRTSRTSTTASG